MIAGIVQDLIDRDFYEVRDIYESMDEAKEDITNQLMDKRLRKAIIQYLLEFDEPEAMILANRIKQEIGA